MMTRRLLLTVTAGLGLGIGLCLGAAPSFDAGIKIENASAPLSMGKHSAPVVCDWNADGKKDLLVGEFDNGHVRLYLNQGTDATPSFNGQSLIAASGNAISTSYG